MIIQSGYGVLAYNALSRGAPQQQGGGVAKSSLTDPAKNADQVTLSNAGRALAADQTNTTQPRTPAQEKLLMAASSDRESAEKIAQGMAETPSTIFYNISGVGGGEEVRKLSTSGRIIDDEFKSKFNSEASVIDAQRRAIYETEKAKGTDPLQILSKMIDFTNSQSKDYLEASGWGYQGSTPPG
jgi:hypothetical protein